jgi:hypothetical protein
LRISNKISQFIWNCSIFIRFLENLLHYCQRFIQWIVFYLFNNYILFIIRDLLNFYLSFFINISLIPIFCFILLLNKFINISILRKFAFCSLIILRYFLWFLYWRRCISSDTIVIIILILLTLNSNIIWFFQFIWLKIYELLLWNFILNLRCFWSAIEF